MLIIYNNEENLNSLRIRFEFHTLFHSHTHKHTGVTEVHDQLIDTLSANLHLKWPPTCAMAKKAVKGADLNIPPYTAISCRNIHQTVPCVFMCVCACVCVLACVCVCILTTLKVSKHKLKNVWQLFFPLYVTCNIPENFVLISITEGFVLFFFIGSQTLSR